MFKYVRKPDSPQTRKSLTIDPYYYNAFVRGQQTAELFESKKCASKMKGLLGQPWMSGKPRWT